MPQGISIHIGLNEVDPDHYGRLVRQAERV